MVWKAAREVVVLAAKRPEILAPAGDRDALAAALASGADAVYLGLDDGFNARARAANFPSTELASVARQVHRAGAKLFVTLNTLVFEPELPIVEELIRRVARAGADAIIVQDPAVALIARAVGLETHASTQMTASSAEAAVLVAGLGVTRVVVPRELSVDDIRAYKEGAGELELEVFVHGALCVAWSGQCLSSEAWGGRSANRGQCAQACRLPYDLVVDGTTRDLGDVAYLLSPKDLVGLEHVRALADIGVASLKIEGRLKGPGYVATTAAQYRRAVDPGFEPETEVPADRAALEVAYSRGPSAGFLGGVDHQTLVEGRYPRHRGLHAGRIVRIDGQTVELTDGRAPVEIRAGMGVVFDRSRPEEPEEGGPIFGADHVDGGWRLRFGVPGPDLANVSVGDLVWINSDPRVTRAGTQAAQATPNGRIAVALTVRGVEGEPLQVRAISSVGGVSAATTGKLAVARGAGLTRELIADKLGAFGGTAYRMDGLDIEGLGTGLHIAPGELKELRRRIASELDAAMERLRDLPESPRIDSLAPDIAPLAATPRIVPLVRDDAQLDAVLDAGAREVELDWMELVGLGKAVARAKARGATVVVATPRIQKPGEDKIDAHLARLEPGAILVRSWGSLAVAPAGLPLHADFSLNVTNSVTARWVLAQRPALQTLTAAHDLDRDQLLALLDAAPRGRLGVTIHHHIPTFHTEHCVYAHLLSDGRDYKTCGRPCESHRVSLKDRVGLVHPVIVDVGCRNTVFNAQAQTATALVPELLARGVHRFRIEFVRESAADTARVYRAYVGLLAGQPLPKDFAAHEQFGTTRGTMRTLTVLR